LHWSSKIADGKCKISHGRQRSNKTKYMYSSEENLKKRMNNLEQVFYFLRNYISKWGERVFENILPNLERGLILWYTCTDCAWTFSSQLQ